MNLRLSLKLMTIPTLMGSALAFGILAQLASAADTSSSTVLTNQFTCDLPADRELDLSTVRHQKGIAIASADLASGETAMLDFSEAESDAAAVLFGCDCPSCINALRQLRSQPLLDSGSSTGHCLTSLQRRVSPQRMQEVLQDLEMREAEQAR